MLKNQHGVDNFRAPKAPTPERELAVLGGGDDADQNQAQAAEEVPVARHAEQAMWQVVEQDEPDAEDERSEHHDRHDHR